MSTEYESQITRAIEEKEDDILELTGTLIEQQSVTGKERRVQEVILDWHESHGLEPDVWTPDASELADHPAFFETSSYEEYGYEDRPNVAATVEGTGGGKSLVLSGHADVVPADPSEWERDPWEPKIESGRLYGRGSKDMLGGIASMLIAYEAIQEAGIELDGDLVLQTTIEEEDGGIGGVLSALERGYQPDGAIIIEPSDIPDIGMASAGSMYFRVTIPGKSAHAARGYAGVNSIGKAVEIYEALDDLDRRRKERISYAPAVEQEPRLEGHETNINIGTIAGGDWPSTIPSSTTIEGRVGWPPGETRKEVRAEITRTIEEAAADDEWLSDHPPEIEWYGWSAEPHEVDTSEPLLQLAKKHAEAVTGGTTTFGGGNSGNDQRFYNLYYDIPCPSLGPRGRYSHGADEYVEIDALVQTAKTLALTAIDWCTEDGTERDRSR